MESVTLGHPKHTFLIKVVQEALAEIRGTVKVCKSHFVAYQTEMMKKYTENEWTLSSFQTKTMNQLWSD